LPVEPEKKCFGPAVWIAQCNTITDRCMDVHFWPKADIFRSGITSASFNRRTLQGVGLSR